jgi:phage terminase large subunit-like protein
VMKAFYDSYSFGSIEGVRKKWDELTVLGMKYLKNVSKNFNSIKMSNKIFLIFLESEPLDGKLSWRYEHSSKTSLNPKEHFYF